jgi:hypothetical protein
MTDERRELEAALLVLADGTAAENETVLAQISRRTDAEEASLRTELRALRLFSVESGLFLGSVADDNRRDEMLGALYHPMIRDVRNDPDPQASVDFATVKSRVELYRVFLASTEGPHESPQALLEKIGQHFATACNTDDPKVAHLGCALFIDVCRKAKRLAEVEANRKND